MLPENHPPSNYQVYIYRKSNPIASGEELKEEEKEAQDLLQPSHLRATDTVAMPYPC